MAANKPAAGGPAAPRRPASHRHQSASSSTSNNQPNNESNPNKAAPRQPQHTGPSKGPAAAGSAGGGQTAARKSNPGIVGQSSAKIAGRRIVSGKQQQPDNISGQTKSVAKSGAAAAAASTTTSGGVAIIPPPPPPSEQVSSATMISNNKPSSNITASTRSTEPTANQQSNQPAATSTSSNQRNAQMAVPSPPPPPINDLPQAAATTTNNNKQIIIQREESQEAAYLNQSARDSLNDSTTADSRYTSNRRLTDEMMENIDDPFGELGASGSGGGGGADGGACEGHQLESGGGGGGGGGSRHNYINPPAYLTKNLVWAVVASAVGSSFQHGYNGGVVNAPEKLIGEFINQTYKSRYNEWATETQVDFLFAIIVSIFCIGGCIGALLTALVADKLGRKEGLMYNNLIVLAASPMMASARSLSSYELLIAGRLLIGINAGLNAGLAPLYLNEIAPTRLRGAFGTIYQLIITISILLSNIFGLPSLLGEHDSWPILFAIPIVPAAFMLAALPHCYESPKHLLLNQGKELQAQQALAWFRQTVDVQDEMEELRYERESNLMAHRTITLSSMFQQPNLRKPLTIAIVIMLSQQFSGINAVLFYSTSIFRDAGLGVQAAVRATLGMSSVNVLMTLVSLFLVDRAGRRTLHMTGLIGMAATCLVLAVCVGSTPSESSLNSAMSIIAVYVFTGMFAIGPGAIPWFLVAELFPSNARPIASSIAVAVNWLANFTVSLCFLPLSNILHGYTFILFAILLVIFYLFTYYKVPETKGATAEEISALFAR